MIKQAITLILALVLTANLASAVIINSVQADNLLPGQEGLIRIEVENILDDDVTDVSLTLNFQNLPFIPVGTSERSIDEIESDDEEDFVFRVKAASDITPGDYKVPYTLEYDVNGDVKSRTGTLGLKVTANPDLAFTVDTDNAIQGRNGQITFKIVNKGFYDARFVSVRVLPEGFTLLSEKEIYIGTVDSDDFETAAFDVIFNEIDADFRAVVEYVDSENKKVTENINLPLKVYSQRKALELGIIKPSYTPYYIGGVVLIIVLFIIWRSVKKRRRLKRSMEASRR